MGLLRRVSRRRRAQRHAFGGVVRRPLSQLLGRVREVRGAGPGGRDGLGRQQQGPERAQLHHDLDRAIDRQPALEQDVAQGLRAVEPREQEVLLGADLRLQRIEARTRSQLQLRRPEPTDRGWYRAHRYL